MIELRDYCSKMVWEITKEYVDEGLSGTLSGAKRPAFNEMTKDAVRWSQKIGQLIKVYSAI